MELSFDSDSDHEGFSHPASLMSTPSQSEGTVENPLPLLIRKLAAFRKGLVRERGMRIESEAEIVEVKEKLIEVNSALQEKEATSLRLFKRCEELQSLLKEQQEMRSNEQKLEKIFSSFGSKKSAEGENKLLKKEVLALKREKQLSGQRIEELEKFVAELQAKHILNVESAKARVGVLEEAVKKKTDEVIETQVKFANLSAKVEDFRRKCQNLERERNMLRESCEEMQTQLVRKAQVTESVDDVDQQQPVMALKGDQVRGLHQTVFIENRLSVTNDVDQYQEAVEDVYSRHLASQSGISRVGATGDDAVGYDELVREFNVFKLRDFFPKRSGKIIVKKNLRTGHVTIAIERAGETRYHPAETVRGAFLGGHGGTGQSMAPSSLPSSFSEIGSNITFYIEYTQRKRDIIESHQRLEICHAINEAVNSSNSPTSACNPSLPLSSSSVMYDNASSNMRSLRRGNTPGEVSEELHDFFGI